MFVRQIFQPSPTWLGGKGGLYQGGRVDEEIWKLPKPLVIVNLDREVDDTGWVVRTRRNNQGFDDSHIQGVIHIGMFDLADTALPDEVFLAYVEACHALLQKGINLYVHCRMGVSRSSYLVRGILMRQGFTCDNSEAFLKGKHPHAEPNSGFESQLRRLYREGAFNAGGPHLSLEQPLQRVDPGSG